MRVRALALRDFRNHADAEVRLGEVCTVVVGPNGSGKTNLLEGLYFGLTGRSCRTSNERELVRHGASVARARVVLEGDDGEHVFEVGVEPGREKRATRDGAPATAARPGVDRPPVSVFLPDRLELVKGAPARRRAHMDELVAALWPARAETRAAYGRALAHRNALLARSRAGSGAHLAAWDVELARAGAALMSDRSDAVDVVAGGFADRAAELGVGDACVVRYRPRSRSADADGLLAELEERRDADLARGFTTHGPHRDDLGLELGGRPLRAFGSQGQQRAALLALLLAERDVLAGRGHPPLLLLDDVMSELDADRRRLLVGALGGPGQVVITTTDADQVPVAADGAAVVSVGAAQPSPVTGLRAA